MSGNNTNWILLSEKEVGKAIDNNETNNSTKVLSDNDIEKYRKKYDEIQDKKSKFGD